MLSSFTSLRKGRHRQERSPFSSPYTALLSSPVAARRSSFEERRRPAADFNPADFNQHVSPGVTGKIDQEQEEEGEEDGQDPDEGLGEDGDEDMTPLLPIFSAAHLGSYSSLQSHHFFAQSRNSCADDLIHRCLARL